MFAFKSKLGTICGFGDACSHHSDTHTHTHRQRHVSLSGRKPCCHIAPMLLHCCICSQMKLARGLWRCWRAGGHVVNLGSVRGRQTQRGRSRWPEQWNNILIYLRGEQWPVCFWSTLSWMTPKQRGREWSHLQLLVTNMAVIRQRWPSQDCRPTLPLPPLPSAQTHTQKGSLFDRAQNTGRLQTLSSLFTGSRSFWKEPLARPRGRSNMAAPDWKRTWRTCWSPKHHLLWAHTINIIFCN